MDKSPNPARRILSKLPTEVVKQSPTFQQRETPSRDDDAKSFLERHLTRQDISIVQELLNKRYPLAKDRQIYTKTPRKRSRGCPRTPVGLSSTRRRALGLHRLPRTGLVYADLLKLNRLWAEYMRTYLGAVTMARSETICQLLWKADFHGAHIRVSRSVCPSLVGIEGIVALETRHTVNIVGTDNTTRCVQKAGCEFAVKLDNCWVKFLGKHFLVKPADRIVKKMRKSNLLQL